ncbi:energy transducer TonB [Geofilum rubicundum]|uniref:TonB C-terminal domain-containing protein n=1 Tax=Geofilum rubicundum JCM 15548 TaxID=1236989 RepID=A0A0E9M2M3_9BACT|nr:energy transducer TonB [Geofilum rubicundum]GAO31360.1 hypothetical protein JCM15548_13712 [Geofilum rubicundum JCM 15548]
MLSFIALEGQKVETFYNYKWEECEPKEARFYALSNKTDSGYVREVYFVNERQLYNRGLFSDPWFEFKKGYFATFYANGAFESFGKYRGNKKDGLWLSGHYNGMLSDSTVYSNGNPVGVSLSWYPNGFLRDSLVFEADGSGIHVSWFDNGSLSAVGRYSEDSKQHGRWKYYHRNGHLSSIELYNHSVLLEKQYYDENGMALNDTTSRDREAFYEGGPSAYNRKVSNYLVYPPGQYIENSEVASVVVTLTVDEEGHVVEPVIRVPFEDAFNKAVLRAVRNSPEWQPAIEHNRRVRSEYTHSFRFYNTKEALEEDNENDAE